MRPRCSRPACSPAPAGSRSPLVIAVAIAAAVTGDTLGYWLGRRGGRAVLTRRRGPFAAFRAHALERGERFFDRHGAKTVFLGRFVPGVRVVAAVLAGAGAMPWPRFAIYNLAGAFVWASTRREPRLARRPRRRGRPVGRRARRRRRRRAGGAGALAAGTAAAAAGTSRGSADAAARPCRAAPRRLRRRTGERRRDAARPRRRAARLPRPAAALHRLPARHRRGRRRVHREGLGHAATARSTAPTGSTGRRCSWRSTSSRSSAGRSGSACSARSPRSRSSPSRRVVTRAVAGDRAARDRGGPERRPGELDRARAPCSRPRSCWPPSRPAPPSAASWPRTAAGRPAGWWARACSPSPRR